MRFCHALSAPILAPFLAATLALAAVPAAADPVTVEAAGLELSAAWTRATAPAARVGAGYLTIHSLGAADRLTGGRTGAAETVELHTHEHDSDGVMRMRSVDGVDIPAGETVTFGPGGLHLMLVGLRAPLVEGDSVPVTLVFDTAGEVSLDFVVAGAGARAHPAADGAPAHGPSGGHHRH